jgi:predicted dehydrogenase
MALRTTLVGCGAAAQQLYRKPLQKLQKQGILRLTGLVDRHVPHAQELQRYFPGAAVHEDLDPALRSGQSDLTLILSPIQLHADQAIQALGHANHVLVEKPMATAEAKCAEMVAAAKAADRILAIGMIRRFFPAFAQFRRSLLDGSIGEIRSFTYREGRVFDWDVKTPAGFQKQPGGGSGLLMDIGPHAVDVLIWLFGALDLVSYSDDSLGGVEGNLQLELKTSFGPGLVRLSWDFPLKNELRVQGSKGEAVLRLDQFDRVAIKTTSKFQEVPVDQAYPADVLQAGGASLSPRLYTQSIYCQLIQLVRAIHLGESPAVDGETGRECVRVIESARRMARPLEMPWLDAVEQEAYQGLHGINA